MTEDKDKLASENQAENVKAEESEKIEVEVKSADDNKSTVESEAYKELNDKYLRLAAEFDNFKKRSAREYVRITESAESSLILELLEVLDDFELAISQEPADNESYLQGMKMIYNKYKEKLEKRGLKEIPVEGEEFDPVYHEAVLQMEVDDKDDGEIIEEVRKGYFLNSKILRPSRVVVARKKQDADRDDQTGNKES